MLGVEDFIDEAVEDIRQRIPGKAIIACSGGVDSMVAATLASRAIGDRLLAVYVDNGHLVAWDTELDYELALNTAKQGFFGKIFHSQTSGEGIVLKFSGKGRLYVCSRNRGGFVDWLFSQMPQEKMIKND